MRQIKVLGITGGVGAGKSTVLDCMSERYHAAVIKCDEAAALLQRKGGCCYEPMRRLFGDEAVGADGEFDRAMIAKRVFADPALLQRLNEIVHPAVKDEVLRLLSAAAEDPHIPFAVLESAILLETGYDSLCDEVWYVYAPEEVRCARLMKSRGYTLEKCRQIMASQKDDAWLRMHTRYVIDNGGDDPSLIAEQIDKGLITHGFLYDSQRQQR